MPRFHGSLFLPALAAVLALAGCGSGGDDEAAGAPAATEVAAGQTAELAVPTSGGTVTLSTREGARFELSLPDGALATGTTVGLITATATASQRFHLRLAPAGTVLLKPATLTLTLPATLALPANGTLAYDGVPLAFTRLADGRLQAQIGHLAGPTVIYAGAPRILAVAAATAPAAPPCGGVPEFVEGGLTTGTATIERYGSCMVGAVNALAASGQHAEAAQLASATAAYLQATNNGDPAGFIAQAGTLACGAYAQALNAAAAGSVSSFDSLVALARPVLLWEMSVQKLGVACPGIEPARYITVIEKLVADSLAFYNGQQGQVLDVASLPYQQATRELTAGNATVLQLRSLGAVAPARPQTTVPTLAREQIQLRAQPALLEAVLPAPWQRCRDSGNFDKLIELMQLADRPASVRSAAQYCATQLAARSTDSTGAVAGALDPLLGGVAAGSQRTGGNLNIATAGKIELSGPIRALQCPVGIGGGSESLQIQLNGTVLQTITAASYLASTLQIDVAQALNAAGLNAASFSSGTLTLHRVGSPCGGFWGDSPEPLLTLNLSTGLCAPKAPYLFCTSALPVPVGDTQEPTLNDRGDLLLRSTQPRTSFAYVARGSSTATPLPADLELAWANPTNFNARGDVLAGPRSDPRRPVVWSPQSGTALPLTLPPTPAGFSRVDGVVSSVLAEDGAVVGVVAFATVPDPGEVPQGCVALVACTHQLVVRWTPPYTAAPTVLDGPIVRQDPNVLYTQLSAINAAGEVVGLRTPPGRDTARLDVVRWGSTASVVSGLGAGNYVHIDDGGTVVYFEADGTPAGRIVSTAPLRGVPDPARLISLNAAGFAVACAGEQPQLVDTRDGRSWSLDAATLVDPASGWTVDPQSLTRYVPCSSAGQAVNAFAMNRKGHWIVRGTDAGIGKWLVLTPKGQPLP